MFFVAANAHSLLRVIIIGLLMACSIQTTYADVFDSLEKALMPGPLSHAHHKFENDCSHCHRKFSKASQDDLCVECHDHKNIADDLKKKTGFHGRLPDVRNKPCKDCHEEHKGNDVPLAKLDKHTFDHRYTDFPLRDAHTSVFCEQCHAKNQAYYKASTVCYDCHKKQDPHGGKLGKQCEACHYESTWSNFVYDHSKTKFALENKHKGVSCRSCHPQEKYAKTPRKCIACHKLDDKHQGLYGSDCTKCHDTRGWSVSVFDHDKDTKYVLRDSHKQVACTQCHNKNPYETKLDKKCFTCHQADDAHKSDFGKKCEDCHTEKAWKKSRFDHDDTKFPLTGKHSDVRCGACHTANLYQQHLKQDCVSCHRHNDIHKKQQGERCENCHDTQGWSKQVSFDHELTRFPLLGAHESLACEECHANGHFKQAKPQCNSCHAKDDKHKTRLSTNCGICHFTSDWKIWSFDHNKQSKFKLNGAHAHVQCVRCHNTPAGKKIELSTQCYTCHLEDDIHDGGYGRLCQRCHNESDFTELKLR